MAESFVAFSTHTDGSVLRNNPGYILLVCRPKKSSSNLLLPTAVAECLVALALSCSHLKYAPYSRDISKHQDGGQTPFVWVASAIKGSATAVRLAKSRCTTAVAECLVALATHTDEVCPSSFCRHQQPNATQPLTKMAVGLLIVILLVLQCDSSHTHFDSLSLLVTSPAKRRTASTA